MVENDAKEIFIIEIQINSQTDYFYRMLFGVSKAITDHLETGQHYAKIRKVYHINIVYFELGQGDDYVYHGTTMFKGIHRGDELQLSLTQRTFLGKKTVAELFPEYYILKVNEFGDVAKDNLDEWIYYLKNNAIPESFKAPGLAEARERLTVDHLPPAERRAYNEHIEQMKHEKSTIETELYEGKEIGKAEGEEERRELQEALAQKEEALVQKEEVIAQGEAERETLKMALEKEKTERATLEAEITELKRLHTKR